MALLPHSGWPKDRKGFFAFADFVGTTLANLFGGSCHWSKYQLLEGETIEHLYPIIDEVFSRIRSIVVSRCR